MIAALRWLVSALLSGLAYSIPELIRRVIGFLGIALVTTVGINRVEQALIDKFTSQLAGLPLITAQFLGMLHIDDAFSMLISAYALRRIMDGVSSAGSKSGYTYRRNGSAESNPWSSGGPPKTGGWF
ncbi:MAG: DUF2523 domain-containing protein [Mucilaginibacter sp.]